jgi:hypothetical protein
MFNNILYFLPYFAFSNFTTKNANIFSLGAKAEEKLKSRFVLLMDGELVIN